MTRGGGGGAGGDDMKATGNEGMKEEPMGSVHHIIVLYSCKPGAMINRRSMTYHVHWQLSLKQSFDMLNAISTFQIIQHETLATRCFLQPVQ